MLGVVGGGPGLEPGLVCGGEERQELELFTQVRGTLVHLKSGSVQQGHTSPLASNNKEEGMCVSLGLIFVFVYTDSAE